MLLHINSQSGDVALVLGLFIYLFIYLFIMNKQITTNARFNS